MRIVIELFVPRSESATEFRLWDENGRRVLAVVTLPKSDRSPLAAALLALPELFNQLGGAGVQEVGWKGFVPAGRLRPASAWLLYGDVREPDLVQAREKALEIAKTNGMKLDPDPAAGRVGKLGELDLAKLLNGSSDSGGSASTGSNHSRHSRLK